MDTITTTDIIDTLKARTTIDPTTPVDLVEDALNTMLAKAGSSISPRRVNAVATLDSLLTLNTLTNGTTSLITYWLALRASALKAGQTVKTDAQTASNALFQTLAHAAGLVVSTKDGDAGVFATTTARDVVLKGTTMIVRLNEKTVATLPVQDDPKGALAMIDALKITARVKGPQPVTYVQNTDDTAAFAASVFAPYNVRRITIDGAVKHPTDLVESAALASVTPPMPSYTPHFHPSVIKNGILSDVQLETIIYAGEAHAKMLPAHPNNPAHQAPRQGFLVGHGTGVGKGRIIAGVIADNWAQGKRRHLWLSESANLIDDARNDWEALGGRREDIIDIRDLSITDAIALDSGIIFMTYAALRSTRGETSRLDQLTSWMGHDDGVVAFDESQNLRNSITHTAETGWDVSASAQGIAATKLQDKLPNARVLYVSATSAGDIVSMGYAVRLGLWGETTSFNKAESFFQSMLEGGTNALEMIARDLKAMGLYLAANLSFDGVSYGQIEHVLSTQERNTHNALSQIWLDVANGLKRATHTTGIKTGPKKSIGRKNRRGDMMFNMARARFFQATIAAMKTPMVIEAIREDIKKGHSAVIQLANTFEANLDKAVEAGEREGLDINDIDATPRDILLTYLERDFPVFIYETTVVNGRSQTLPKVDKNGDHVMCPIAKAERDTLINKVKALPIPEGPLEQLFAAFDSSMIAEATGRKRRLVRLPNGQRVLEERENGAIKTDVNAFMDDQKRILVFSDAGATGATYSAAKTRANRRLRRHYVLQPGWRADKAIQGMGRTHRSNQEQPPEYILPSLDLWADQRMVSRVARGMRDLGALTRGLRQAASQDFFTQDENLEDEFGQTAWVNFVQKLARGDIHGLSLGQFANEANIPLHVIPGQPLSKTRLPRVQRFLNAMSAMSYESQGTFGRAYRSELDKLRLEAVASGDFDRGIETIRPDSLIKLEDAVIYRDPRTGGETRLLKMLRIDTVEPLDFATARSEAVRRGNASVVKSMTTGRIAVLSFPRSLREMMPKPSDIVRVYTPTGMRERTRADVVAEGWQRMEARLAEPIWNAERSEQGDEEEKMFWVVTGAMLPIWNKLPRGKTTVYRMETDESEQIIGRIVSETFVTKLLKTVDAMTTGGLSTQDVVDTLSVGGVVSMANGWSLVARVSSITDDLTVRLVMPEADAEDFESRKVASMVSMGMSWARTEAHYFVNRDALVDTVEALLKVAPAVSAASL